MGHILIISVLGIIVLEIEGIYGTGVYSAFIQDFDIQNPPCILATPKLRQINSDGNMRVDIPDDWIIEKDDDNLMIGYVRMEQVFTYRGCTKERYLGSAATFRPSLTSEPGGCLSLCDTEYFGIHGKRCFCLENLPTINDKRPHCTTECEHLPGVVCGGKFGDTHFTSIYQYRGDYDKDNNNNKNCYSYNPADRQFQYLNCNVQAVGICYANQSYANSNNRVTWSNFLNQCFEKYLYPAVTVDESKYDGKPGLYEPVWLGRIKSWTIYNSTELPIEKSSKELQFGYIKRERGIFHLKFAKTLIGLSILCLNGTFERDVDKENKVTTQGTFERDVDKENKVATPDPRVIDPDEEGDTSIVAVYVTIPIVLIAIIAITIFLVYKRRRNTSSTSKTYTDHTVPSNNDPTRKRTSMNNSTYEPKQYNQDTDLHDPDYSECTTGINNDANVYDTTKDAPTDTNKISDNVYNCFKDTENNTYDHAITSTNQKCSAEVSTGATDVYDTAQGASANVKGMAKTTDNVYSGLKNMSSDTYDHAITPANTTSVNDKARHNTDTIYNCLNDSEDSTYAHAFTSSANPPPVSRIQETENVYNEFKRN